MTRYPYLEEFWSASSPKCPHCERVFQVWGDDFTNALGLSDGDESELECPGCDKTFICVTEVQHLFSSAVSEEAAEYGDWGPQPADKYVEETE